MRRSWLLGSAAALAVLAALTVGLVRATRSGDVARPGRGLHSGAGQAALDPRVREVVLLAARKDDPRSWQELVARYGSLAGDASAFEARVAVLNALFSEPALGLRLKRVLDAIEADPTPAPQDPLWPELVQRLAQQWSADVLPKGRDLMLMEKRT